MKIIEKKMWKKFGSYEQSVYICKVINNEKNKNYENKK